MKSFGIAGVCSVGIIVNIYIRIKSLQVTNHLPPIEEPE